MRQVPLNKKHHKHAKSSGGGSILPWWIQLPLILIIGHLAVMHWGPHH